MTVSGIDVSNHNGSIDWSAVAKAGLSFAFVKATEGATYDDPAFACNYAGARSAGLLRGAYNFARPGTSTATDEATAYVQIVADNGGFQLPPALDMEDTGGLSNADLITWCRTWEQVVSKHDSRRPLLYASSAFIRDHGLVALADTYDLWLADYAATPDLAGWPRPYVFWQTSQTGSVPGIDGDVDTDVFNGSIAELQALGGENMQQTKVVVNGKEYPAVVVNGQTYILWTALEGLPGFRKQLVKEEWHFETK